MSYQTNNYRQAQEFSGADSQRSESERGLKPSNINLDNFIVDDEPKHRNRKGWGTNRLISQAIEVFSPDSHFIDEAISHIQNQLSARQTIKDQNQQRDYPLQYYLNTLVVILKQSLDVPSEPLQTKIVAVFALVRELVWQRRYTALIKPDTRTIDAKRIDQVKTLMDIYNAKMKVIRANEDLSLDNQKDSIEYLRRLRERDVALLEGES